MRERSKRCGALHGTAPFLVQIWAGGLTAGDRFDAWSRQKRAWSPTGISRPMPTGILRWAITRTGSWVPQASRLPLRGLRCTQDACGTTDSIARWSYRVVVREYGRYYRYSINVNTCIFTRTPAANHHASNQHVNNGRLTHLPPWYKNPFRYSPLAVAVRAT